MEHDMTGLRTIRARVGGAAAIVGAAALIAACGSSAASGSGATSTAGAGSAGTNAASVQPAKAASGGATTINTTTGSAGKFLVGAGGRAIYLWDADKSSMSTCTGACAQAWPPVLTKGTPKGTGGVKASELGTSKRSDGTTQVTYNGHPLYYYVGDTTAGSTTGQGSTSFGAPWWLVNTAGTAIGTGGSSSTAAAGSGPTY
jgi:predicted lipoprotein with Yx(FWY)xxD motif